MLSPMLAKTLSGATWKPSKLSLANKTFPGWVVFHRDQDLLQLFEIGGRQQGPGHKGWKAILRRAIRDPGLLGDLGVMNLQGVPDVAINRASLG